jgi:epoxyqueuosine reductase
MGSSRSNTSSELRDALTRQARGLGFARLGVAAIGPLEAEAEALRRWIADGHHGSMGWMADTAELRLDPEGLLEGARRVVVVAASYAHPGELPGPGTVARYARGRDYHNVLGKALRKLARTVRSAGYAARGGVDALPVLERAWAQRAGLGFIGKNCCLIVPGLGSHVLLGWLLTDASLPTDAPMAERCGSCRRCLEACPTDAFVEARRLDARRCIAYLTIEHRGPIDEGLMEGIGDRLFGCDVCQDVCPFNRTPAASAEAHPGLAPLPTPDARAMLDLAPDVLLERLRGRALQRPRPAGLARNAAIVLGHVGETADRDRLEARRDDPDAGVRRAALWALDRLSNGRG